MQSALLYYVILFLELGLAIFVCTYTLSMLFSFINGSPYISTKGKSLTEILQQAELKPGMTFLELGCGDGRVVRTAVQEYGVKGIGVDINPTLIWLANLRSQMFGKGNLTFRREDIFQTDFSQVDVIYLFLFPALNLKLKHKLTTEPKRGTLLISHGFKVSYLEPFKTVPGKFKTYYYRLNKPD